MCKTQKPKESQEHTQHQDGTESLLSFFKKYTHNSSPEHAERQTDQQSHAKRNEPTLALQSSD